MSTTSQVPLWDVHHPYYCEAGNFRASSLVHPEVLVRFESWPAFRDYEDPEMKAVHAPKSWCNGYYSSDPELNLLFRWDWKRSDPDDYEPDADLPAAALHLYFVLQRKADLRTVIIDNVTEADEPEIRAWLAERAKAIAAAWAPFVAVSA